MLQFSISVFRQKNLEFGNMSQLCSVNLLLQHKSIDIDFNIDIQGLKHL